VRTDILRTIQNTEDTTVYDQVVAAIFDDVRLTEKTELADRLRNKSKPHCPLIKKVGVQEWVIENVKEVFTRHGARPVESTEITVLDDPKHINGYVVLVTSWELFFRKPYMTCFGLRFVCWAARNN